MGSRLKVNALYETKLETKGSTIFNFDPPLPEANVLRTWCLTHSAEIKNLDIDHLNQIGTPVTPAESPFERDIIKINRLPTVVSEPEYYWIHPVCKITDLNQNFFYMSCSKCNHGTDATDDTEFWCNFCHEKVEATPRCKFNVTLSDSTGDIAATAFTKVAESMFGITALYLKENTTEDGLSMAAMETITKEVEYVVRVKAYKYGPEEKSHCLFNVHQFDEVTNIRKKPSDEANSSSSKKIYRQLFIEQPPSNFSDLKDGATVIGVQPVADDFVPPKQDNN